LVIEKDLIKCNQPDCTFQIRYACPICEQPLTESAFIEDEKGMLCQCQSCKNRVYIKRIKYFIENGLLIDHKERCHICGGPTIHRKDLNLAHRCFFFPGCSGQIDLFGMGKKEILTFLDFETTGLDVSRDEIIEIGAIKIDEDGLDQPFQTFIKPEKAITESITKLTGITEEMVSDAPDLKTGIQSLIAFIGDSKIVAHNAQFDIPWLLSAGQKFNIPIQSQEIICTYKWATALKEASRSLTALTKKYKITHNNAHRALADAAATRELFFIFENMKKEARPMMPIANFFTS